MRRKYCSVGFAAVVAVASNLFSARADDLLAAKAAAAFEKALPGFDVSIVDPLTLKIGPHGHPDLQVNLDRVARFCAASPADCDHELADFVSKGAEMVRAQSFAPTKAALRAVVRPADYVEEITKELDSKGQGIALISEPIANGLVALCYFDEPTTMRVATTRDVASLGLAPATTMQICKSNTRTGLRPLQDVMKELPAQSLGTLEGDPYESSYLLLHDDWSPLAAQFGGMLFVSVPSANVVLYGDGRTPEGLQALSAMTKQYYEKAERPISADIFRWKATGWEKVTPP